MRKTTVKNLIHLLIISLPMLLLLIACIFPTKQINNTYALEETTTNETEITLDYNQQFKQTIEGDNIYIDLTTDNFSNIFFSLSEANISLINNHKYMLVLYDSTLINVSGYWLFNNLRATDNYSSLSLENNTFIYNKVTALNRLGFVFYATSDTTTRELKGNLNIIDLTQLGLENISYNDFIKLFPLSTNYTQSKNITLSTLTITNNIGNQAEQPLQSNETKQPNELILTPFKEFYALSINDWYRDVLNLLSINLQETNIVKSYILYYPLWLMWFYLFELIEMIITAVPRIIIKITGKIGGGESV